MESILMERQIDRLYHFTQVENLPSILEFGLLPRSVLEDSGIHSEYNDKYRYDDCPDAVCMSLEHPNYKMFYSLRRNNPSQNWVVMLLNISILLDYRCAYCSTNAGDSSMYCIPIKERMGKEAFIKLFNEDPFQPTRAQMGIPSYYPTNPQAEVLVFDRIPSSYIEAVYFEKVDIFRKYGTMIPSGIESRVDSKVFSYRSDWSFW